MLPIPRKSVQQYIVEIITVSHKQLIAYIGSVTLDKKSHWDIQN